MNCIRAREVIQNRRRSFHERAALWGHLSHCADCRAAARTMQTLRVGLQEVSHATEPPLDLLAEVLAVPEGQSSVRPTNREGRKMKRLAFVALILLVLSIGTVLVVPGKKHPGNSQAHSILIGVVQAMEQVKSFRAQGRVLKSAAETLNMSRMIPFKGDFDLWLDEAAGYVAVKNPDGTLSAAYVMNVATNSWWLYFGDKKVVCRADLRPVADGAAKVIAGAQRMFLSAMTMEQSWKSSSKGEESVRYEERDGREVALINVTFDIPRISQNTGRFEMEVDTQTNRILAMRTYIKVGNAPEELVEEFNKIEYDVPLPTELAALTPPKGTKVIQATAEIKESDKHLSLVIKHAGNIVAKTDVSRDQQ